MSSVAVATGTGWARVDLAGEVDLTAVPAWQAAADEVLAGDPAVILVDVARVSFMDSSGIGVLARLVREARTFAGSVSLLHPSPMVRSVLEVSGLDRYLDILDRDATLPVTGDSPLADALRATTR